MAVDLCHRYTIEAKREQKKNFDIHDDLKLEKTAFGLHSLYKNISTLKGLIMSICVSQPREQIDNYEEDLLPT